jgi:outer membrane lipoprotein SlyB
MEGNMAGQQGATSTGQQGATSTGASTSASSSPNSTVVSIEVVPRSASDATGAGTVAGAAVGSSATGATGSSMTSDRVYRITLRMDDGSTQVVTQETTPDFRSGDRVNVTSGVIQH